MRRHLPIAALAMILPFLAGCAERPPASQPDDLADYNERNDPLEPTNRKFYALNDALDRNAIRPVAAAYRDHVPDTVRQHLHNTLANLGNPGQFANDVLQGHPRKAGNTFMRLLINTTLGVGGVFDVASGWGFPDHDNDFGLTLAVWGVGDGPFLFLPVLGPSNPRDGVGFGMNTVLDPLTWVSFGGSGTLGAARFGAGAIDTRAGYLDQTDAIEKTALDPYATYRTLYQQHRASEVGAARPDLPGSVPAWYPKPVEPPAAPPPTPPPAPSDRLAPPASITP